jgi:hypothetical protein
MMVLDWARRSFAPTPAQPPPPHAALAAAAHALARGQIGRGEGGANNAGPDVDRYRKGGTGGAWCAAFLSWCLEEAWTQLFDRVQRSAPQPVKRSHSAKTLFANCLRAGAVRVERPSAGDIVLWHRGAANARTGHIGIVSRVEDNAFWEISGNRGAFPSRVREFSHELGEANLIGFARMP